ncbi:MAG: hypothetical protein ACI9JR_002277, partial [Gammaproteobacteria bacterium]
SPLLSISEHLQHHIFVLVAFDISYEYLQSKTDIDISSPTPSELLIS